MTIVDKIINSIKASQAEGFEVYYHDDPTLNVETSGMTFPCALVYLLTTGRPVQEAGQVKERVTAAIFFVEPAAFDFDAVKNEEIIDRCKERAFAWLLSLPADPRVELYDLTRTERIYGRYDDILTGYALQAEIQELNGIC